jgi:membrane-associated protein
MTALFYSIFNEQGMQRLLHHDTLTAWMLIGATIYLETALIFLLFLPVDSLIFAAGAFVSAQHGSIALPTAIFSLFALGGDATSFAFAHSRFGKNFIRSKWVSRVKIARTRLFFQKYGLFAIFGCRFIGFARSFSPLAAGLSRVRVGRYLLCDSIACVAWTSTLLLIGYRAGKVSWIQLHLGTLSVVLIMITLLVCAVQGLAALLRKRA